MRLYRGLKEPYRPEKVVSPPGQRLCGTDFTDCPLTALRYAHARRGTVIVLDVHPEGLRLTQEFWLGMSAKRFKAWGKFDAFITAVLPAKELRALIRVKGVASAGDEYQALVLRRRIQELTGGAGTERGSPASRAADRPDRR
jgi:hypothetical protein